MLYYFLGENFMFKLITLVYLRHSRLKIRYSLANTSSNCEWSDRLWRNRDTNYRPTRPYCRWTIWTLSWPLFPCPFCSSGTSIRLNFWTQFRLTFSTSTVIRTRKNIIQKLSNKLFKKKHNIKRVKLKFFRCFKKKKILCFKFNLDFKVNIINLKINKCTNTYM